MEDKKESIAEIYAKLPTNRKLDNFTNMVPWVVTVRDDVSRQRFTVTDPKGRKWAVLGLNNKYSNSDTDNRDEQKDFLASELQEAQQSLSATMRKVTAAKNRLERKKITSVPGWSGAADPLDDKIKDLTIENLKVK